ncbi:MAG: hypothetical protein Q9195_006387 [Heterodermia aff. obscurata]
MVLTHEPPQQYSQASRKGKKAWRKNVDLSDVQAGLESAREEIIQGGIIVEKPSEDLFTLDATGSEPVQKAYNKIHKPLKTDQILAQRSAIPAVESRKRSKVTDGIVQPNSKRQKRNGVSHKEYQRLQNIAYGGSSTPNNVISRNKEPNYDPWAPDCNEEEQSPRSDFLSKPKSVRAPKTLKQAPVSLVKHASAYPAVPRPKADASYNPVFEDYDKALVEEGMKEVEAERRRLQGAELEKERLLKIEQAQKEEVDIQTEDDSVWEGIESEFEAEGCMKRRGPERKTPAERNKMKRRKEVERQAKRDAQVKRKAQQAQKIKEIVKEVSSNEGRTAVILPNVGESLLEYSGEVVLRRKKLGKSSIPEAPLELVLPEELQDSLRLLKPEGNLLKDRFRNILMRGKIETRRPIQQPKRPKRQVTEKWSYKDWETGFIVT